MAGGDTKTVGVIRVIFSPDSTFRTAPTGSLAVTRMDARFLGMEVAALGRVFPLPLGMKRITGKNADVLCVMKIAKVEGLFMRRHCRGMGVKRFLGHVGSLTPPTVRAIGTVTGRGYEPHLTRLGNFPRQPASMAWREGRFRVTQGPTPHPHCPRTTSPPNARHSRSAPRRSAIPASP